MKKRVDKVLKYSWVYTEEQEQGEKEEEQEEEEERIKLSIINVAL